ncbi:hypothetical protein EIP91_006522 [Steccherinum ochraceum]|uniref:amidase n=1 Tax=Steccherinum ochraceum TaxID=92696 RepID=A0A4R0RK90_9APHY|nr:hypothetical protein EIP91_006522 [Steccherinum ochraceum]
MNYVSEYLAHKQAVAFKQQERQDRIDRLPSHYHTAVTSSELSILNQSIANTVRQVHSGTLDPSDVLLAYSKKALKAHAATNCLTEVMIDTATKSWVKESNSQGPLAGIPVSLKDQTTVEGYDACIGYSAWTNKPMPEDGPLVRMLKDAGAVPYVKTNVPITLLSFESYNDVFGRTLNPHNKDYSPGGSSGGEGALLAYGGSRFGMGTDVGGSLRCPAHYCGVYTIKSSMGRMVRTGAVTSVPGLIGVPAVYSPMTRTLDDLETVWRGLMSMKPWEYDYSCIPLPWREVDLSDKKLKFGVIWDDGVAKPSPACRRALEIVVNTLKADGHTVVDINPPSPYEGFKIGLQLLLADACKILSKPMRPGESNDASLTIVSRILNMSWLTRRLYVWYLRYLLRDEHEAGLIESLHAKTIEQFYAQIVNRETYRFKWFQFWKEQELDFVLCVPNALPAVPHGGPRTGWKTTLGTMIYNVLDYTAGVMPITKVDRTLDTVPKPTPRNTIEREAYAMYDADSMHGLPVGVQLVGQKLEEEKVLEGMKLIARLLRKSGLGYEVLETKD